MNHYYISRQGFTYCLVILIILFQLTACNNNNITSKTDHQIQLPDSLSGLITLEEYQQGWLPLLNGKDLSAWKGYQKSGSTPGWLVSDSLLITKGDSITHPVDIITLRQFEDFELEIEWAICWQGNSGIFYHSLENSWAAWAMGPEYSLVDEENLDEMDGIYKTGACYDMYAPGVNAVNPQGMFNTSRIKVKDAIVEHWLNGEKLVEYELWSEDWYQRVANSKWKDYPQYGRPIKGSVGLQGHGFETKFKNIRVRDITDYGKPISNYFVEKNWLIHGEGNWELSDTMISGKGLYTGISAKISQKTLDKDFMLRFQLMSDCKDVRVNFATTNNSGWMAGGSGSKPGFNLVETGFLLDFYSMKINANKWNDIIIRRKGNQVLVWLNKEMIIEENKLKLPPDLQFIGFSLSGEENAVVNLRNILFRVLKQ